MSFCTGQGFRSPGVSFMAPMERWIERYQRRVRIGEFLHRAAEFFAVFLFCWGGAILVSRLWVPQWWPHVLWLGLGAIPAAYGAWWLAGREKQTRAESVARLDKTLGT